MKNGDIITVKMGQGSLTCKIINAFKNRFGEIRIEVIDTEGEDLLTEIGDKFFIKPESIET